MIDIEPAEFLVAVPGPSDQTTSLCVTALARGNVERPFSGADAPSTPGPMTFSCMLWPRRGTTTISLYDGDEFLSNTVLEQHPSWRHASATASMVRRGLRVVIRLGRPGEQARALDEVLLPVRQATPQAYFVSDSLHAAVELVAAVDAIHGFPKPTAEGRFRLTHGYVLKHPAAEAYAVPVTSYLVDAVRSGRLEFSAPAFHLEPEWVAALPVPLSAAHAALAGSEFHNAFVEPALLGPDGAPMRAGHPAIAVIEKSLAEIAAELNRDPNRLHAMDPIQFEHLIGALLRRDGYLVEVTARSGDGGVDVFAVRNQGLGKFLFGVQCKRFKLGTKIKPAVVREMVGTLVLEDLAAGAIVSTSLFGPAAHAAAQHPRANISLVDYHGLCRWLRDHAKPE